MKLLIGSPVYKRDWILPHWFSAIKNQNFPLSKIGFIFETGPEDPGTKTALMDWHWNNQDVWCFDIKDNTRVNHVSHADSGTRKWTKDRYHDMVILRNSLLRRARILEPNVYLSLDTDIILEDPESLNNLVKAVDSGADAVSPLIYMSRKTTAHPGVMTWVQQPGGRASRRIQQYPIGETFEADVIMAAKMMSPDVYQKVDYEYHRQGEDLGWSYRCFLAGFTLQCASGIYAPHIMSEDHLYEYIQNGDRRLISAKDVNN